MKQKQNGIMMVKVVFYDKLRIVKDMYYRQQYEPILLHNVVYYYNPPNIDDNFGIYFEDISKYNKYNEIFVNILYPNFTKIFNGLLAIFDLTEEELFYLKLNEVNYEIIH